MNSVAGFLESKLRAAGKRAKALAGVGSDAPVILMYHRVAEPAWDPWGLCVSPANFRDQLAALRQRRTVMSMDDLVDSLDSGEVPPRATALTFDDGYVDNYDTAKPLLEEANVPATMFLSTSNIGNGEPFWWEDLAAMVLGGRDPAQFDFEIGAFRLMGSWPRQDMLPADLPNWRYRDETHDPRRLAYLRLWQALHEMDAGVRAGALVRLREVLGGPTFASQSDDRPMTRDEAARLSSSLVTLGAHGRTHVLLPGLSREMLEDEIVGGKGDVTDIDAGSTPSGFAYPHGEWNDEAREIVASAGFPWAVTTRRAKVDRHAFDRFTLPRMEAGDGPGHELIRAIVRLVS